MYIQKKYASQFISLTSIISVLCMQQQVMIHQVVSLTQCFFLLSGNGTQLNYISGILFSKLNMASASQYVDVFAAQKF